MCKISSQLIILYSIVWAIFYSFVRWQEILDLVSCGYGLAQERDLVACLQVGKGSLVVMKV